MPQPIEWLATVAQLLDRGPERQQRLADLRPFL